MGMNHIDPEHQAEVDRLWASMPEEWRNLPDDEVTACGMPLGLVHPDIYDENNKPRE
ncbi:hypothetical protein cauri_1930 [Corynebacterium aurimucosum ATCC 700975]|uniref:Uncharacterized protein n=2 Tax=Corynebacterium aurimucosum TaxID=169292 RepID=C3PI69_CORA7|nr:hypothetical protein cauri_1930 [Corynebacterium aurimucosum ATCC 700975]